jgi:hypothetical protein
MAIINGYICVTYKATEEQYTYVSALTEKYSPATRHLFCHLLVSTLVKKSCVDDDTIWIPVGSALIKKKLRGARWQDLESDRLIQATDYFYIKKTSREYKVMSEIVDIFIELHDCFINEDESKVKYVNLFTGRAMNAREKSNFSDDHGHCLAKLPKMSAEIITKNQTVFNRNRVEAYLKELKNLANKAEGLLREAISKGTDEDTLKAVQEVREAIKGWWQNDSEGYKCVKKQLPERVEGEIWKYPAVYDLAMSGRLIHRRIGLQSVSRGLQEAAFSGIENLWNYDLVSSQLNGLLLEFSIAGLSTDWLTTYLNNPNAKRDYANRAGLPVDIWKESLLALCFGANLPTHTTPLKDRKNTILNNLKSCCEKDDDDAVNALLKRFRAVVLPLYNNIKKWHKWLANEHIPNVKKRGKGGWYIENAAGMTLNVDKVMRENYEAKVRSMFAAFYLQGRECAFIHNLTALSTKYKFKVIFNMHDGIITIGKVPDESVREAALLSGLKNAKLVVKEFENNDYKRSEIERKLNYFAQALAA